jgi:hypothetical protein
MLSMSSPSLPATATADERALQAFETLNGAQAAASPAATAAKDRDANGNGYISFLSLGCV